MHVSVSLVNGESRVLGRCNVDFFFFFLASAITGLWMSLLKMKVFSQGDISRVKIRGSEFEKHIPQVLTSLNRVHGFL